MSAELNLTLPSESDLSNINDSLEAVARCFPDVPRDVVYKCTRDIFYPGINPKVLTNKLFRKLWIAIETQTNEENL